MLQGHCSNKRTFARNPLAGSCRTPSLCTPCCCWWTGPRIFRPTFKCTLFLATGARAPGYRAGRCAAPCGRRTRSQLDFRPIPNSAALAPSLSGLGSAAAAAAAAAAAPHPLAAIRGSSGGGHGRHQRGLVRHDTAAAPTRRRRTQARRRARPVRPRHSRRGRHRCRCPRRRGGGGDGPPCLVVRQHSKSRVPQGRPVPDRCPAEALCTERGTNLAHFPTSAARPQASLHGAARLRSRSSSRRDRAYVCGQLQAARYSIVCSSRS